MNPRPNDDAWVKVPLFAALGYLLLLVVVLPQSDGSRWAAAGWLALPAVIAVGGVTLVAATSKRRWSRLHYAVAAPAGLAVASVLSALVLQNSPVPDDGVPTAAPRPVSEVVGSASGSSGDDTSDEPSADPSPTAGETASTARLVTPESSADWTRLATPEDLATDAQTSQRTQDLYSIADVAVGSYSPASRPDVVFRYVGVNGHIGAASPEAAGRAALVSVTGSSAASFPPLADGWLGCNTTGTDRVACAWVGDQRAVFLRFEASGLSLARAAAWTRSFRDAASEG